MLSTLLLFATTLGVAFAYRSQYQSSSSSSSSGNDGQTAEPIALNTNQPPQTLAQVYGSNGNGASVQKVLKLNFAQQPNLWDPRKSSSQFHWSGSEDYPADNAHIEVPGASPYGSEKPYASGEAALISAPFQRYQPLSANLPDPFFEGDLTWNNNASIGANERVVARLWTSCKILDADKYPSFPARLISHPDDDPRLANCYFLFSAATLASGAPPTSNTYFSITNKSIWAVYNSATFSARRRVGVRQSYNDLVDIAIEYNAMTGKVTYYVAGQPVWDVSALGLPPPQDGVTKIDAGQVSNAELQGTPRSLSVSFGPEKCLDESDPWNQSDRTLLVKTRNDPQYYGTQTFFDSTNKRSNVLWGQTVKQTLKKLVILSKRAPYYNNDDNSNADYNNDNNNNGNESDSNDDDDDNQDYAQYL